MKFTIDGREYEDYQLSNKQLREILYRQDLSQEEKDFLMNKVLDRFTYSLCPKAGEEEDEVFANLFSDYVNKCPNDYNRAVEKMSHEHRYLQNEMFIVCLKYIKKLSENFENDIYDARNQYACETSNSIIESLKEKNIPY